MNNKIVRQQAVFKLIDSLIAAQLTTWVRLQLRLHFFPQQARRKSLPTQITVDGIMAEASQMISNIRQCLVDLAPQQKLAVVEFAKGRFDNAFSLPSFLPAVAAA